MFHYLDVLGRRAGRRSLAHHLRLRNSGVLKECLGLRRHAVLSTALAGDAATVVHFIGRLREK